MCAIAGLLGPSGGPLERAAMMARLWTVLQSWLDQHARVGRPA